MNDADRERQLLREFNELRFAAPNARDFPNWNAFAKAQAEHEASLGEIERRIAEVSPW